MVRRPQSVVLGIAAAVVALLWVAPTTHAGSALHSERTAFRSALHGHGHLHRCHEPGLSGSIVGDEDDDVGISDDDAALHVSVAAAPLTIVAPPIYALSEAQDVAPASECRDTGSPRAPPRTISA